MSVRKISSFFFILFLFQKLLFAASIAASISPLSDIAKQIDPESEVITLLPPGANPHAFELNTKLVKILSEVKAVFIIGHGLDDWMKKTIEAAPAARLVVVDKGIGLLDPEHSNPHYWLSVKNAKIISKNIADTLTELEPGKKDQYQKNLSEYHLKLDQLDREIKTLFAQVPVKKIVTFHDSWPYFASEYGLEIIGTVEACEDQGPTPKKLVKLTQAVKTGHVKVLFTEPEVSRGTAESIARDLGVALYQLNPIGRPGQTYIELMLENAKTIQRALIHD